MTIGEGAWPRIAAHQDSVAVVWKTAKGSRLKFAVGGVWQELIDFAAKEVAIAYSPKGIWLQQLQIEYWICLESDPQEIKTGKFTQPTLSFDINGNPLVAHVRGDNIMMGQVIVATGNQPTLLGTEDGRIHLAYLHGGKLFYRLRADGNWSEPREIPANSPAWPVLADGLDGVRLTYLADATRGPQALWLCRGLSLKPSRPRTVNPFEPLLMPSVAGNVSKVSLLVDLTLRQSRATYRRHDAIIRVNGIEVGRFQDTVPEGRYEFPLNPLQVFYSPGRPTFNRVSIQTHHMNGGHYLVSSGYRLITTTEWSEFFAFAATESELLQLDHNRPGVNHDQPDLTILANSLDLPVEAPTQPVDFPVIVANLGEARSQNSTLVLNAGTHLESEATVPALDPDEQYTVIFRIEGGLGQATFELRQSSPDFKPSNDSLTLHLWEGGGIGRPSVQLMPAVADVTPHWVNGKLPLGAKQEGSWSWNEPQADERFANHSSGITGGRSLHSFSSAEETLSLDTGENLIQYVFLNPDNPPKDLVLMFGKYTPPLYWGPSPADLPLGRDRKCLGDLPPTGKWIRLKIPLAELGIKAQEVDRMKFGHLDGQVFWGPTTKSIGRLDLAPTMQVLDSSLE